MRYSAAVLCWLCLLPFSGQAQADTTHSPPAPVPATPADIAWKAMEDMPQRPPKGATPEQSEAWRRDHYLGRYIPASRDFYRNFPDDPRHWEAGYRYAITIMNSASATAEEKASAGAIIDAVLAGDAPETLKLRASFQRLRNQLSPDSNPAILQAGLGEVRALVDGFRARFEPLASPMSQNYISFIEQGYVDILLARDPALAEERLRVDVTDSNPEIAQMAAGKLKVLDAGRNPMQLKFTAVDGREVDLENMRGKVVLVDFWATWCGPCIAELPNVQKVHQAYHDKGFEIVGVSLDSDNARQKLLDFVKERNMSWPQYFDGKGWDNALAKQFAVRSIPAMFVLDKAGRLVTTDASGPKLEETVKRLLAVGEPAAQ